MATLGLLVFLIFIGKYPVFAGVGFAIAVWAAAYWKVDWEYLLETAFATAALASLILLAVAPT